jgi:hypothetical protein
MSAGLRASASVCACVLFAACVGLLSVAAHGLAGDSRSASIPGNQLYAQTTAQRLLEEVPLPEGAVAASSNESFNHELGGPESTPVTSQLVQAHAFWRVPGQPKQVIQSIEQHPPQGAQLMSRGSSGTAGQTTSWGATFSFADTSGRLATVWLSVGVAQAAGGGTALQADALVVWARPRPPAEHVPAGVRIVKIRATDLRRHISLVMSIGSPAEIRAIVAAIEALQRPPQGGTCAGGAMTDGKRLEPVIDLAFATASGRPPIVRVKVDENTGCGGSVAFWAGERPAPDLGPPQQARVALHEILRRTL